MITNQVMKIRIGNEGALTVGHKEQLFKVKEIMDIGNKYIKKNISESAMWTKDTVRNYLRSESTWRTIIAIHNTDVENKRIEEHEYYKSLSNERDYKGRGYYAHAPKSDKKVSSYYNYAPKSDKKVSGVKPHLLLDTKETMQQLPRRKANNLKSNITTR